MNNETSSLKEYYIKLERLYNNAVNMLTAINQSLSTSASEVTINVADTDDTTTTVKIPSFLYLENKLESIDNNFSSLFEMPYSGEAWFQKTSNMFKLQLVKSNSAPITPTFDSSNIYTSMKDNNILKDMVSPKMYMKVDISNIPDNIDEMFIKKFVFYDKTLYTSIKNLDIHTYEEYKAALYNNSKGIDYDVYDFTVKLPIKQDQYKSNFKILSVNDQYISDVTQHQHYEYKLTLDTLIYTDQEDSSIEFKIKTGDYLSLTDKYCIYKVKNVSSSTVDGSINYDVILEEYIGHIALQSYEENQNMQLQIYNENYSKYHYVEIPLEENPYISVFLGTVYNNVRSILSTDIQVNLDEIYIHDENGNYIYDTNSSNPMTYIQYYNKYCKNIGDLILGLTETAYPQISNFSNSQLNILENGEEIKNLVTSTVDTENILKVVKINSHLIDDKTSENILSLHEQKSELNTQLNTIQSNIDQIYNQLTTTDFSQEVTITQNSLRSQLDEYYQERLTLQKQIIAVIDNINLLKGDVAGYDKSKYRIRGQANTSVIDTYLHNNYNFKCDIISLEVEYKYKSVNSDSTTVTNINSSIFTDWNKLNIIDRQRTLVFDAETGSYNIEFVNYDTLTNIIKWNQIDIPIQQGEDVVLRIRYKFNIGQPFINLYTPWSDEYTMTFPTELVENSEISTVISDNETDTISAKFTNKLINDGYQEHISDKIIDNSNVFFHMPEHIYSGFNTPENKLISLKDKLNSLDVDLNGYKTLIENELNGEYKVYLEWDGNTIEISNNTNNRISINDSINSVNDTFIRKNMNIIVKNTGDRDINFYSIFPGNQDVPLIIDNEEFYEKRIINYERVPILIGDSNRPSETIFGQTLGQWIYFRQFDVYTNKSILYYTSTSNTNDATLFRKSKYNKANDSSTADSSILSAVFTGTPVNYMDINDLQAPLAYRQRVGDTYPLKWGKIEATVTDDETSFDESTIKIYEAVDNNIVPDYSNADIQFFKYDYINFDTTSESSDTIISYMKQYQNNYILKYEHIGKIYIGDNNTKQIKWLSQNDSISEFISDIKQEYVDSLGYFKNNPTNFCGAFLIPELKSKNQILCDNVDKNQYLKLPVGKSVSIPIIFEYYLNAEKSSIQKSIYFDLRSSLLNDPEHFSITINATYNYIQLNSDTDNTSSTLNDSVTKDSEN